MRRLYSFTLINLICLAQGDHKGSEISKDVSSTPSWCRMKTIIYALRHFNATILLMHPHSASFSSSNRRIPPPPSQPQHLAQLIMLAGHPGHLNSPFKP